MSRLSEIGNVWVAKGVEVPHCWAAVRTVPGALEPIHLRKNLVHAR